MNYQIQLCHKQVVGEQCNAFLKILQNEIQISICKRGEKILLTLNTNQITVKNIFETSFTGVHLEKLSENNHKQIQSSFCLKKSSIFPVKFCTDTTLVSLYSHFAAILKSYNENETVIITICPASKKDHKRIYEMAEVHTAYPKSYLALFLSRFGICRKFLKKEAIQDAEIKKKVEEKLFFVSIGVSTNSDSKFTKEVRSVLSALDNQNSFEITKKRSSVLLSTRELENFFILPSAKELDLLKGNSFRKISSQIPNTNGIKIGESYDGKSVNYKVGTSLVVGQSGSGKSSLVKKIVSGLLTSNKGFTLIDPHEELAKDVLTMIPKDRLRDVIYFNPLDECPIPFNPLCLNNPYLGTSIVADSFASIFRDSFGRRSDYLLRNAIYTLICAKSSLVSITRLFYDTSFRRTCLNHVNDSIVRQFWFTEFDPMPKRLKVEAISPILNKINRVTMEEKLRHILGQSENALDFEDIIDNQKILIVSLNKGKLGADNVSIFGALLLFYLGFSSMGKTRDTTYPIIIDELQNFETTAAQMLSTIVSESRKYGVCLISVFQHLEQLSNKRLLGSLLTNAKNIIGFKTNRSDAEILSSQIPNLAPHDFVNLPVYQAYSHSSLGTTLFKSGLPNLTTTDFTKEIIQNSRNQYAYPKRKAELEISNFMNTNYMP